MKTLWLLYKLICLPLIGGSQLTISAGTSFYLGDLGGNKGIGRNGLKDFNFRSMGYSVSVAKEFNGFDASVSFTHLHDADSLIKDPAAFSDEWYRYRRDFYFSTSVIELSILKSYKLWNVLKISSGFTAAYFTSLSEVEGSSSRLQPLILFAIGLQRRTLGVGINYRKTFTDYIDGVSLRGDPKDKDAFFTLMISYTIIKKKGFEICPRL